MNLLICGLGSMGKRRIRLLKKLSAEFNLIGVDSNESRCNDVSKTYNIDCCLNVNEAVARLKFDAAFVCTSPLSHYGIIKELLEKSIHVFTELNLTDEGYDELIMLAQKYNRKLFLSSTLNYRKDIQYIQKRVTCSKERVNYIYHVGQYLADWHPWESYKDYFVGCKKTNGCREIFAIDLPWIYNCFGSFKSIHAVKDKITDLDIDWPDNYLCSVTHENGNKGVIAVDVVSRHAVRKLEVFSENGYIIWEGHPDKLFNLDIHTKNFEKIECYTGRLENDENYAENILENAYTDELLAFFDYINNDKKPLYTYAEDKNILNLIDEIEGEK